MDVSIIIVNYNTYKLTSDCIRSIFEKTLGINFEVILVDNASKEIEDTPYEKLFPNIKVIRLPENLGFAGGNNAGLPYATGKYILLLNSDTLLIENSIFITFEYLENNPKAGVVSARLIHQDGRHQSAAQRFPSVKYKLAELFRIQKFLTKRAAGTFFLGAFFEHNRNVKADWVWGAYFMFRREILNFMPSKKLDDTYFMYYEDIQWCIDIKRLGYEIHFCADTSVIHFCGGNFRIKRGNDLSVKSRRDFFKKNYSILSIYLIKGLDKFLSY